MHDSVDQIHGDGSLKLLEKYLRTEEEKRVASRAAEESMMAWQIILTGFIMKGLRDRRGADALVAEFQTFQSFQTFRATSRRRATC
jgi:hypothetical protein